MGRGRHEYSPGVSLSPNATALVVLGLTAAELGAAVRQVRRALQSRLCSGCGVEAVAVAPPAVWAMGGLESGRRAAMRNRDAKETQRRKDHKQTCTQE